MAVNGLIAIKKQIEGQARVVLKGAGLGLIKPKFFSINNEKVLIENESYELSTDSTQGGVVGYDSRGGLFGLPVWDTVRLVANPYTTNEGVEITTPTLIQFNVAIVEVSNPRNIIKTQIAGRNGTIKEYMSDGDYAVSIKGVLSSDYSNVPPVQQLRDLKVIIEHPEALTVYSNFLDYFDITSLVIEEPIIKQREGTRNIVDFELRCVSDKPFLLNA